MVTKFSWKLTAVLVAVCCVVASCSNDGVEPTPLVSIDLQHEVGTQIITRTIEIENSVALSTSFDTVTVAAREVIEGGNQLVMEDGRVWRVRDGLFQLLFDQFTVTLGKVPCPVGRWPEPVDTISFTNDVGDTLTLRLLVFTTRSSDTTITVPAGSFRSAVVDGHWESSTGERVEETLGTMQVAYAPGVGYTLIRMLSSFTDGGKRFESEQRTELYRIER